MKKTMYGTVVVLLLQAMVLSAQTNNSLKTTGGASDDKLSEVDANGNYVTGITDKPSVFSSVKVYPNPSNGVANFTVLNRQNKVLTFSLYDARLIQMRYMENITKDEFTFVNDGLKNGIYFYRVTDKNNNVIGTGKLILTGK